jgi:hypothetical protein
MDEEVQVSFLEEVQKGLQCAKFAHWRPGAGKFLPIVRYTTLPGSTSQVNGR